MKILFFGDIYGKPGRFILKNYLAELKDEFQPDVCIANCENIAQGRGITEKTALEILDSGIDVLTGGNHLYDKKESVKYISEERRIVRMLNFPKQAPGNKYFLKNTTSGKKLAVVSLCGQAFMGAANSPFEALDEYLPEIKKETNLIFVDFHAEATAEKRAFGFYFDGRVTAIVGTHTHIQTADEDILPKGTAYITDVGMTGPHDSIIGVKKEIILDKIMTGIPNRYEVADTGLEINAVLIEFDEITGESDSILRIKRAI